MQQFLANAPQDVVLATMNAGKAKEFSLLSPDLPWRLRAQAEFDVPAIEETGLTFIENALLKAHHASKATTLPAIGDDSGLIVDALQGAPGLYSARYAGENASAQQNIDKLLYELSNVPPKQRTARFYCALVFVRYFADPLPIIAESFWEGSILLQPEGSYHFGYDPIFYVPTHDCSAANMTSEAKMQVSHRGQAWRKLVAGI